MQRDHVSEGESVAKDNFPAGNGKRSAEYGPGVHEGMKFAIFAARVDALWQFGQKLLVKVAACE
jgi:hypothetical protein